MLNASRERRIRAVAAIPALFETLIEAGESEYASVQGAVTAMAALEASLSGEVELEIPGDEPAA